MAHVLQISRSGYYQWKTKKPARRKIENHRLGLKIKEIYAQSHCVYGSPKITNELRLAGYCCSRPRTARIMREMGIRSVVRKKYKVTTESSHQYPVADNILNRNFKVNRPNMVYVSDITYLPIYSDFYYLTVVMDLFNREPIGWSLSHTLETRMTVIAALRMAFSKRRPEKSALFHSDRGIQYASSEFSTEITRYDLTRSMSRKGNCWDNAVMENFFRNLKTEWLYRRSYRNNQELRQHLFYYLEVFYPRKRIHAALNYLTPAAYLEKYYEKQL